MTEEELRKSHRLILRLDWLRGYFNSDYSKEELSICKRTEFRDHPYTSIYTLDHEDNKEILPLVEKWTREEIKYIVQELTDMGIQINKENTNDH